MVVRVPTIRSALRLFLSIICRHRWRSCLLQKIDQLGRTGVGLTVSMRSVSEYISQQRSMCDLCELKGGSSLRVDGVRRSFTFKQDSDTVCAVGIGGDVQRLMSEQ